MWEYAAIQISLPSPKSSLERSIQTASADCNNPMLKLSSPCHWCWCINVFFAGEMIEPVECRVLSEVDAMDSIVLSTCAACCTIQLLCNMLSPLHFPLQLPPYEPMSWLDQGYNSDQASGGLSFLWQEYCQVPVHQVHWLWVDEVVN